MRKFLILFVSAVTLTTCLIWIINQNLRSEESIIYFPINPELSFSDAKTEVSNPEKNEMLIRSFSRLNKPVNLRQDITLIFANGRLIDKMGKWKESTETITNQVELLVDESSFIQAISYHHAEIQENDQFSSAQSLSGDSIYFIRDGLSFKEPTTEKQANWKQLLDDEEKKVIRESLLMATETFSIDINHFEIIPLTNIIEYQDKPLPNFSMEQSQKILGQLWEGLYKNYFVNIKKEDGTVLSPINSTIPIIYLAKNQRYLYVSFITSENEPILLKQKISH